VSSIGSATGHIVSDVLASQLVAFLLMSWLGFTRSLFVRACYRDGEGISFNMIWEMSESAQSQTELEEPVAEAQLARFRSTVLPYDYSFAMGT